MYLPSSDIDMVVMGCEDRHQVPPNARTPRCSALTLPFCSPAASQDRQDHSSRRKLRQDPGGRAEEHGVGEGAEGVLSPYAPPTRCPLKPTRCPILTCACATLDTAYHTRCPILRYACVRQCPVLTSHIARAEAYTMSGGFAAVYGSCAAIGARCAGLYGGWGVVQPFMVAVMPLLLSELAFMGACDAVFEGITVIYGRVDFIYCGIAVIFGCIDAVYVGRPARDLHGRHWILPPDYDHH
eukprot:1722255-Rhodomonas_salina.1